jgi:hypothetical protein
MELLCALFNVDTTRLFHFVFLLQFVKTLAKSPTFARNPREFQFETDMNRLFLFTRLVCFFIFQVVIGCILLP